MDVPAMASERQRLPLDAYHDVVRELQRPQAIFPADGRFLVALDGADEPLQFVLKGVDLLHLRLLVHDFSLDRARLDFAEPERVVPFLRVAVGPQHGTLPPAPPP